MEVRCFQGNSDTIQNGINLFIKNEKPKIKDIKLTGSPRARGDGVVFMALVMFEPPFAPVLFTQKTPMADTLTPLKPQIIES